MNNLLEKLQEPLKASEIDFRVQSINKGGYATILAYKDARIDINRLNKVVGPLGWMRSHSRDNHNCAVSIWDPEFGHWVSKEDTGTESYTEAAKGLASDSFKRACFNWGIGIELYDYPVIQVKLNQDEFNVDGNKVKQTWNLRLRDWVWRIDRVDGEMTYMGAKDQSGKLRWSWGKSATKYCIENKESVKAIIDFLSEGDISKAAEAWFELPNEARVNLYVAEKNGGPFNPQEREIMRKEFQQYYQGEPREDWFFWDGITL